MCPNAASDTAMALARPAIISQGYLLRVEDSHVNGACTAFDPNPELGGPWLA